MNLLQNFTTITPNNIHDTRSEKREQSERTKAGLSKDDRGEDQGAAQPPPLL